MTVFVLKIIAVVSMLIDHTGAVLFPENLWLRIIGRLAFPIYCFLIAQGARHTRSLGKYIGRLALFALVSEIPYDLAFHAGLLTRGSNVYFTLLLGLIAAASALRLPEIFKKRIKNETAAKVLGIACAVAVCAACAYLGDLMDTDYGSYGVILIFIFACPVRWLSIAGFVLLTAYNYTIGIVSAEYFAQYGHYYSALVLWQGGTVVYVTRQIQSFCLLSAIPIALYNGEAGEKKFKWFFYIFYPAHLLILWAIGTFA